MIEDLELMLHAASRALVVSHDFSSVPFLLSGVCLFRPNKGRWSHVNIYQLVMSAQSPNQSSATAVSSRVFWKQPPTQQIVDAMTLGLILAYIKSNSEFPEVSHAEMNQWCKMCRWYTVILIPACLACPCICKRQIKKFCHHLPFFCCFMLTLEVRFHGC